MRGYLKFNLTDYANITYCELQIYYYSQSITGGGADRNAMVFEVDNQTWQEHSITWNNRPSNGSYIDSCDVLNAWGWYYWNVTSWAQTEEGGNCTIMLQRNCTDDEYRDRFYAKEAPTLHPNLTLQYTTWEIIGNTTTTQIISGMETLAQLMPLVPYFYILGVVVITIVWSISLRKCFSGEG